MGSVSSICTIANRKSIRELKLMIKTARIYHDVPIYLGCDSKTRDMIGESDPDVISYNMIPDKLTPQQNCQQWLKLMLKKTEIMDIALNECPDTLFVDADMIFIAPVRYAFKSDVVLSPHYINKNDEKRFGRYNGGYVWTKHRDFPSWWRHASEDSQYYEQECLVRVSTQFDMQEFGMNHNFSWWRLDQVSGKEKNQRVSLFSVNGDKILYEKKPLVSVHTHIYSKDRKFTSINKITRKLLSQSESKNHQKITRMI